MPTKKNRAGQQQNYVPAGNGDASGEFTDGEGNNKNFKSFGKPSNYHVSGDDLLVEDDFELTDEDLTLLEDALLEDEPITQSNDEYENEDNEYSLSSVEESISSELEDLDENEINQLYDDYFDTEKLEELNEKEKFNLLVIKGLYDNLSVFNEKDKNTIIEMMKDVEPYMQVNYIYSTERRNNALWCKTLEESKQVFSKDADAYYASLTRKEQIALDDYTGSDYKYTNSALRNKQFESEMNYMVAARITTITKVLDGSISKQDVWLQRGTNNLNLDNGKDVRFIPDAELKNLVGTRFTDAGFVSCGSSKSTGFTYQKIIMNIFAPKGTSMMYLGSNVGIDGENETLINRGYQYHITKVEKNDGKIYLDVEIVEGSNAMRTKVEVKD